MSTIRSSLSNLLPQVFQIVLTLLIARRKVIASIAMQDLIIFLLRMGIGVELDCWILALEERIGGDDNKSQCNFYLVDQSCILDEQPRILQKFLICVAPISLAPLHYPGQQPQP